MTHFVILGVTGDLAQRKIIPALFHLSQKKRLPRDFRVIGFSRRDWDQEKFRGYVKEVLSRHESVGRNKKKIANFARKFFYQQGYFDDKQAYQQLKRLIFEFERKRGLCSSKLFYLAVPPRFYQGILTKLASSGLTEPCSTEPEGPARRPVRQSVSVGGSSDRGRSEGGWVRVLVEKPFGKDLKSARALDRLLGKLFQENQIYRIDHYLAKEMAQNILSFRFANYLLEDSWNRGSVEKIEIRLWEEKGVEDRGAFYDGLGALRDVGQNHLLQLLAFLTMEHPGSLTDEAIRRRRSELLSHLRVPDRKEIKSHTRRAQYQNYQKIKGAKKGSQTETYFSVRAFLDLPRWQGVPIYLESGKRMPEIKKEVVVTFRHPTPCLCPTGEQHRQNKVVFAIEPREGIFIYFWAKRPGLSFDTAAETFEFLLRKKEKKSQYIEEYVKLLLDALSGDQTLFLGSREIEAMWQFIDPIVRGWQKNLVKLEKYKPGTKP